jgi:hypothetical protein
VSTPASPPPPDFEDLRGLARGLRLLVEIGARTLTEDAGPSELARGVDAYLAEQHSEPDWFGSAGVGHRPHEDMLSLITTPVHLGPIRIMPGGVRAGAAGDLRAGAASYGTAPVGPEEKTEVVTFGLFSLLDAMDGVGADADVTFALTTNRGHRVLHQGADQADRTGITARPGTSAGAARLPFRRGARRNEQ